jgi:hypothetical protein
MQFRECEHFTLSLALPHRGPIEGEGIPIYQ